MFRKSRAELVSAKFRRRCVLLAHPLVTWPARFTYVRRESKECVRERDAERARVIFEEIVAERH